MSSYEILLLLYWKQRREQRFMKMSEQFDNWIHENDWIFFLSTRKATPQVFDVTTGQPKNRERDYLRTTYCNWVLTSKFLLVHSTAGLNFCTCTYTCFVKNMPQIFVNNTSHKQIEITYTAWDANPPFYWAAISPLKGSIASSSKTTSWLSPS